MENENVITGRLEHDPKLGWMAVQEMSYRDNNRMQVLEERYQIDGESQNYIYKLTFQEDRRPTGVNFILDHSVNPPQATVKAYILDSNAFSQLNFSPSDAAQILYDRIAYEVDNNLQPEFRDRLCTALVVLFAKEILDLRTWNRARVEMPVMTKMFYEKLIIEAKKL